MSWNDAWYRLKTSDEIVEPRIIQADIDRHVDHTRKYFDVNWTEQDFSILYPRSAAAFSCPEARNSRPRSSCSAEIHSLV